MNGKGVNGSADPNNLGVGFACMRNGFHKAGEVVDSPQVIVARNCIVGSFTLYDVSLSTEGIDKIHSDVWSREIISTLRPISNHLVYHNIKVIIVLLFTVMF